MNKKIMGALAMAGVAMSAAAQTSNEFQQIASSITGGVTHDFSMRDVFVHGGYLMYPIAGLSIVTFALILYYFWLFRAEQFVPARFVAALQTLLRDGKLTEARATCHSSASAVATVMEAAIDYAIRSGGRPDPALLAEIVEGEGARQATQMQNQTQHLQDIGVISPMIGLLGTVWGMLKAFNAVSLESVGARPIQLAGGVSISLLTPAGGLFVAIPAMAGYFYYRNRASKLTADLEITVAKLLLDMNTRSKS